MRQKRLKSDIKILTPTMRRRVIVIEDDAFRKELKEASESLHKIVTKIRRK